MNIRRVSSPPRPRAWKLKKPELDDLGAMLNHISDPAVLIEQKSGEILFANSSLLNMAGLKAGELGGAVLNDLLIDPFELAILKEGEYRASFRLKNTTSLGVLLKISSINQAGQLMLVRFLQLNRQLPEKWHETLLNGIFELARLAGRGDLESALEQAVQILHNVLDLDLVGIYQSESDYPQLRLITAYDPGLILPDILPASDLIRLTGSHLWFPGKRVSTELHRAGRLKGASYLSSIPLGQEGAWMGLLVVGGQKSQPVPNLQQLLTVIGSVVSMAIENYILVSSQRMIISQQQESLALRDVLAENVSEGILVVDREFKISEVNPVGELMFGYTENEIKGEAIENILIGSERLIQALNDALDGIPTHNLGQTMLHHRDGHAFPSTIQTIPVEIDGKIQEILILVNDISENEQNRVRAQQLEQRAVIGEVIQVFAHEVRNPINNISLTLDALASQMGQDDPNQDFITRMQGDCLRLSHLMESILASSKPLEPRFERLDLSILLRKILERWRPRLAKVNVTPFFQVEPNIPPIKGDPRSLEQVFTNLISNSVDAMARQGGGTLALRVSPVNAFPNLNQVEATVTDSGPGIPDELRDHIFEPFVSNNPRGTGLGLAISKQIVTAHHGSIKVNTFPGGTMFQVILPAYMNGDS